MNPSSDRAFSSSIRAVQRARGSRKFYEEFEAKGGFLTEIDTVLRSALSEANSAYFVTASASGQPYAQHRGGPSGFIRVVDDRTIGFADYLGNRQYITMGNLTENPQAFLFLMDYEHRRRFKIWGPARSSTPMRRSSGVWLRMASRQVQATILFETGAWDMNCPQNIPQTFDADAVVAALVERDAEIARLKSEVATMKSERGDR